jgi:hypothetical protein
LRQAVDERGTALVAALDASGERVVGGLDRQIAQLRTVDELAQLRDLPVEAADHPLAAGVQRRHQGGAVGAVLEAMHHRSRELATLSARAADEMRRAVDQGSLKAAIAPRFSPASPAISRRAAEAASTRPSRAPRSVPRPRASARCWRRCTTAAANWRPCRPAPPTRCAGRSTSRRPDRR